MHVQVVNPVCNFHVQHWKPDKVDCAHDNKAHLQERHVFLKYKKYSTFTNLFMSLREKREQLWNWYETASDLMNSFNKFPRGISKDTAND